MRTNACTLATVLLLGCGSGEPQATAPGPTQVNASAKHPAHVRVSKCTPVGFGFSCEAELDGDPATLEVCVGSDDHIGLTPRITPPITLSVDVEPAADTDRYCGILIVPSGKHVRIVAVH